VLENAKRVLADRGVLVIQDFARPDVQDPRKLDHQVSWFGQPYSYRTFVTGARTDWQMREVLRWENGRCRSVAAGADFATLPRG
jgi:hypothetical protein